LDTNVTYTSLQKGHFRFKTPSAVYDTKKSLVVSDANYTIILDYGKIWGTFIKYDGLKNKVYSKNIDAIYQLQESK